MARPSTARAVEPLYWTRPEYAPSDVQAAFRLAQSGELRLAGELAEAMLSDDRVAAALGTRVKGLLGLPLRFEPANRREGKTVARALEEDFWAFAPENALYEVVVWGLMVGVGLARLVWEKTDAGRVIPKLEPWHPSTLRFDSKTQTWRVRTTEGEIELQPGQWWLFMPYGSKAPWRFALWRQLAIPWLVKRDAIRYWARDNEIGAIRVGKASGPITPQDREQLAKDLAELGSDTAIALPEGYSLDIVAPPGEVWQSKAHAIEWADRAITVAILGQNLTTEVKVGSYAAARVHDAVRRDLLEADAETLATGLRDGVLAWWAEFNFGNASLAPWPVWDTAPPADLAQGAEMVARLAQAVATLASAGAPVDIPALLQEYGLPLTGQQAMVRLASGDRLPRDSGFVSGQLYADALVDAGIQRARLPLEGILRAVQEAQDYEGLRARLLELVPNLSPDEFAGVMEKALILADLAGRYAVLQDVEG